jgi:hypothetical protein
LRWLEEAAAYDLFDKTEIEEGDEEFARRLFQIELEKAKPRPEPPRGKKIYLCLVLCLAIVGVGAWLIAKYVPGSKTKDAEDDLTENGNATLAEETLSF